MLIASLSKKSLEAVYLMSYGSAYSALKVKDH